ncbi:MAG TPA: GyrI-like domain-containing protein [Clostridia bacterium]|nr:GyrI-like domain-containing protein [Clostridia bacterium]
MLSIGEFSKICGVTAKTLRYYDEIGLIEPDEVREETGYRYYAIIQLERMLLINRLKSYCFSLEEIKEILEEDPTEERLYLALTRKRREIEQKRSLLDHSLRQMAEDMDHLKRGVPIMAYLKDIPVQLMETQPMNILSIRRTLHNGEEYGMYIGKLYETIAAEKLTPLGGPLSIYHNPDYNPESVDAEIAVPVKEAVKGTRTLPGGLCAKSVCKGPYSELHSVYVRLTEWMEQEAYELAGAPYEVYLSGPAQAATPSELTTEIYFPVKKKR